MKDNSKITTVVKSAVIIILIILAALFGKYIEDNDKVTFKQETIASSGSESSEYESEADVIIDGKININSATVKDLMKLDGIGEKRAQDIIDYRNKNGGFKQIEGIMMIPGIGDKMFEKIKDKICIE